MKRLYSVRNMLCAVFLLALAVRFVPVLVSGVPVGLDSYLHIDIAKRILENGSLLSLDPMSLLGLKAYSYPPGFHVLLAFFLMFLPEVAGSHFVGAMIGALSCIFVFFISEEIFTDRRVSLFSALFFATSPIHIFRTAMPIPEGFGVLLFTASMLFVVRWLKGGKFKNALPAAAVFAVYVFSHRGWSLFVLSMILMAAVYYSGRFRKKRYLIGAVALIGGAYYGVTVYFADLLSRINVEAVTAIGYIKWLGLAQLFFAATAVVMLHKTRDKLQRFLIVWAFLLLAVGSVSFRFRDPYAAIPISMLAGYGVVKYLLPIFRKRQKLIAALGIVVLLAVGQAVFTSLYIVESPGSGEMEALNWIKNNTPKDSIILTWKEEGYYIMGVTERKDILTWKKIYQGFFEEPPSVDEAKAAYRDMFVMFRSANREWMLRLMNSYSVDYIYIDARMRSELDALKYGLVDYLSYDTHFRPVFANDEAEIYQFVPSPMLPERYAGKLTEYMDFGNYTPSFDSAMSLSLLPYLEEHWNGISYLDHRDYRAHYPDITEIIKILLKAHEITGSDALKARAAWLMKWLEFEQLEDGGFFDQKYESPKKSAAATCGVASDLYDIYSEHPELEGASAENASSMLSSYFNGQWVRTTESSLYDDYRTDAVCLPAFRKLSKLDQAASLRDILLRNQNPDGSWPYGEFSDRSTVNSQTLILAHLIEYYRLSGDDAVREAVIKGAHWLSTQQNDDGMFWNYVTPGTGKVVRTELVSYPRAAAIYGFAGMDAQKRLTLDYLAAHYSPEKGGLEALVQIMSDNI
ncbi:MAG: glycosyltransferase family 39 protein [Candidatus Aenigmarchaeota archaeon]|nr:glycosyltransferase family 39 protein [Candidatus Aenigmarchaeota archaeon]